MKKKKYRKDDGGEFNSMLFVVVDDVDFAGISSISRCEEGKKNVCERPTKTISHITSPTVGPEG